MKEYLLDFLKEAVEYDIDKLPNVVFLRHLKVQLEEQVTDFGLLPGSRRKEIETVLGNIDVNFAALGSECDEEDNEFLLELATITATLVWKMYDGIVDSLGEEVFLSQVKKFNLSLT